LGDITPDAGDWAAVGNTFAQSQLNKVDAVKGAGKVGQEMTGDVEEAVLEMYISGISVRKIAGVSEALSRVRVGKDAVSRIARRLEEEQRVWRERPLGEKAYPYLYLDATYLKVRWGAGVTSMAL